MQPAITLKKKDFEYALFQELSTWEDSDLKEVTFYALDGEAKRIRPLIALEIALALDPEYNNYHPMIALELAHTSSLIMDDLPLMDDAELRRNKEAVHRVFGEQRALLSAVGLISESFLQLKKGAQKLMGTSLEKNRWDILVSALEVTSRAGGLSGAPLGQWFDLTISQENPISLTTLMDKKTGVFFESAFVLGWIFGGGILKLLPQVIESAQLFGAIFQAMDDFFDQEEDARERPFANFVLQNGESKTLIFLEEKKERLSALLKVLNLVKLQQVLLEPLESLLLIPR